MARQSRLSQLPERPPLPPLPEHVDPEDGYRPIGAVAQREAQKLGVRVPIHIHEEVHAILVDVDKAVRKSVDPPFHCELLMTWAAMQATAQLGPLQEEGVAVMKWAAHGLPLAVERRGDRLVVRMPEDEEE